MSSLSSIVPRLFKLAWSCQLCSALCVCGQDFATCFCTLCSISCLLVIIVAIHSFSPFLQAKCARYWPELKSSTKYKKMRVTHTSEEQLTDHILRILKVENTETKESRLIYHYYFMSWPDHGVPAQPGPVLAFMEDIDKQQQSLMESTSGGIGPMVVHCRYVFRFH